VKLLLDQNLSRRLCERLDDVFPESTHVASLGLSQSSDNEVWQYAKANNLVIASKDSDFHQRSFLEGAPPKVIWIRTGNCTTEQIEQILRRHQEEILKFGNDPESAFLELG
jgi:predicted nuclease of predicted toxin-antitoxin system